MGKRKKTNGDEPDESPDMTNESEDNFGLPDIEYKPLDEMAEETEPSPASTGPESQEEQPVPADETVPESEEPSAIHEEEQRYVYSPPEEKSNAPVIIGIVIALVVVVSASLIYFYYWKPKAEKARQEQLAKEKAAQLKKEADARVALERQAEEARQKHIADSIAAANATPAAGAIETLSERTRRYYVVVASAIDDDLIMDKAKKLSAGGVGTKIIPPFGKYKFYRLAIGDYDSFATAQSNADAAKENYGDAVWVLKY